MAFIEGLRSGIKGLRSEIGSYFAEQRELSRSVKVGFDYYLPRGDLDTVAAVTEAVKRAHDLVTENDSGIKIFYGCPSGLAHAQHSFTIYGPDESSVMSAFSEFIQAAGSAPNFVNQNPKLAEDVLANFGKRLQRTSDGGFVGKHVVDMPDV